MNNNNKMNDKKHGQEPKAEEHVKKAAEQGQGKAAGDHKKEEAGHGKTNEASKKYGS